MDSPITEPLLSRWFELSEYSLISPSEHIPYKSDREIGELILARLLDSLARKEYEYFNRFEMMVSGLGIVVGYYLDLSIYHSSSLLRKIIDDVIRAEEIFLQTHLFYKGEVQPIVKKIEGKANRLERRRDKEWRESDIPWLREPNKVVTYELVEILNQTLGLSIRKSCKVVTSILHEFDIEPKEDSGAEAVRSRYNRFKRENPSYSSNTLDIFTELMTKYG